MIQLLLFILGSVFASYVYTTVGRSIAKDRKTLFSECNFCHKRLVWYELIPILSYFIQAGKCRKCHKTVPIRYLVFEIMFGLVFIFIYLLINNLIESIGLCLIFSVLFYISYYDFITQEISELLLVGLFGIILVFLYFIGNLTILNIYGAFISGGIIFLFYYISKEQAMGFGDVELSLVLGFLLGSNLAIKMILLAFILGGIYGSILLILKLSKLKDRVAFGPFLALSSLIVYLFN